MLRERTNILIEIHGQGPVCAKSLQDQIYQLFNWEGILVKTVAGGAAVDREGKSVPFLRIFSDGEAGVVGVLTSTLAKLEPKMPMQVVATKFIPIQRDDR